MLPDVSNVFIRLERYGDVSDKRLALHRIQELVQVVYGERGVTGEIESGILFYETKNVKIYLYQVLDGLMFQIAGQFDSTGVAVVASAVEAMFEDLYFLGTCTFGDVTLKDLTIESLGMDEDEWVAQVLPVIERIVPALELL